jgi:hypothetical protein
VERTNWLPTDSIWFPLSERWQEAAHLMSLLLSEPGSPSTDFISILYRKASSLHSSVVVI